MMKRAILGTVAFALLAALGALWFVTAYERIDTKVWVGPSAAARANPYLAATRFIERIGLTSALIERASALDTLPEGATLILLPGRAALTPERASALLRWAERGGHLIVAPEPLRYRDPMLEAMNVGRRAGKLDKPAPTMTLVMPGAEQGLRLTPSAPEVLDLTRVQPELVAADAAGPRLASLRRGAGRTTILTGVQRFQNRTLGAHDNAELLRQVLNLAPSSRQVFVLRPPRALPLWDWIEAHALGTIIVGFALVSLWLWRILPRFGPVRPAPEPERKQLLEHIRACGRFRWANGARAALLGAAREVCQRHIAAFHPHLAHLSGHQRHEALARQLGTGTATISRAFEANPHNAHEFVQVVSTLASIHADLSDSSANATAHRKRR